MKLYRAHLMIDYVRLEGIFMNLMLAICMAILITLSLPVYACVSPRAEYSISPSELIEESEWISYAKVVSGKMEGSSGVFSFQPIRMLKGEDKGLFKITVPDVAIGYSMPVEIHEDYSFWVRSKGGTGYGSGCTIRPNFYIGRTYLIFHYNEKLTLRSSEEVYLSTDKWLVFVEEYIKSSGKKVSPIFEKTEFINQFSSLHLYRCPSRAMRGRPILVDSFRGVPPEISPWPRKKFLDCGGTGNEFLYLREGEENPAIIVPVINGYANFKNVSHGVELIESNMFSLKFLKQ